MTLRFVNQPQFSPDDELGGFTFGYRTEDFSLDRMTELGSGDKRNKVCTLPVFKARSTRKLKLDREVRDRGAQVIGFELVFAGLTRIGMVSCIHLFELAIHLDTRLNTSIA